MDVLFALLVIGGIILSNVNKKKKREQQAAQKRAAEARAAAAAAELDNAKPVESAPRPAPVRQPAVQPAFEKYPSIATAAGEGETAPAQAVLRNAPRERSSTPPKARMETTLQTTLRDKPYQHRLDSSAATGHAHEETSITGVQGDCVPGERPTVPQKQSAPAPVPGFVWDQNAVLSGLVMAEILGKPKCLRGDARQGLAR